MRDRFVVSKYSLMIWMLLVVNTRFFYQYQSSWLPIKFDDFALLCVLMFEAYIFVKFFRTERIPNDFSVFIWFIPILMVTSSIMASITYNQPFAMGLLPQRHWFVWLLGYFPLIRLLKLGVITKESIIRVLYCVAIIYLSFVTLQYLLPNFQILNAVRSVRFGEVRLYVGDSPIILLAGHALYRFLKMNSTKHGIFFIWCVALESLIMKGRAGTITMLVAAGICMILSRNSMKKKLFQYGMAFILLLIFLQTDMGQNLIQTFTNIEGAENSEIRSVGREYYVRMLLQDWKRLLFGCGFANLNWAPALGFVQDEYVLAKQGFVVLPVDNGMYGFALYYGLLGIFWAVILYAVCIKKAWIIFKRSGNFMFLFCLIWDLLGSATLYLDCTYSILEFPIILSMIEMYSIEEERCIDGI